MKSSPLGWLLGIAAIVAAARVSVGGDSDAREIIAKKITVGEAGSPYSIVLDADAKGCQIRLQRASLPEVSVYLSETVGAVVSVGGRGATASMNASRIAGSGVASVRVDSPTRGEDAPSVSMSTDADGAIIAARAWGLESVVNVGRSKSHKWSTLDIGAETTFDDSKADGAVLIRRHAGLSVFADTSGAVLNVRDGAGVDRVGIGSARDRDPLDGSPPSGPQYPLASIRILDESGRPTWSVPPPGAEPSTSTAPQVPLYTPTVETIRPPPRPADSSGAAVLQAWGEWSDGFAAVEAATSTLKVLSSAGAGGTPAFAQAVARRDEALRACLVLKRRYEAAVRGR